MGIVAAMHVGVVLLIAQALVITKTAPPPDIVTTIYEEPKPIDDPPPLTQPKLEDPIDVVYVPPVIDTFEEPTPSTDTITAQTEPPNVNTGETGGSAEPVPNIVSARPDPRRGLSQPPYPPGLIRAEKEGTVEVEVYVMPDGRVSDARIVRSAGSGLEAFDRSTLDEARRRWKLQPATRDGVAFAQWYRLRVTFKLENR